MLKTETWLSYLYHIHCVKSVHIWNFPVFSVFIPNVGKYGPEKLRIQALFTQWYTVDGTVRIKKPWLGRLYHFKFFKGCLPQILLGPFLNTLTHLFFYALHPKILLIQDRVIKSNLGPNSNFLQNLSTCHWNLNSVTTQNFLKLVHLCYNLSFWYLS